MPTITTHYGITGPVPFVDVEVTADNRLYVDPHAIRLRRTPQPFANQALECVDTFTHQVTDSIIKGAGATGRRGERLLQRFVEPWETRLGMSAKGFHGQRQSSTSAADGGSRVRGRLVVSAARAGCRLVTRRPGGGGFVVCSLGRHSVRE